MIKIAKQRIERVAREACNIYWSCMYQQGVLCLSVTLEARAEQERKRKSTCGMFPEPPLLDCLVCKVPQANNAKISSNTSWQDFRRFKRFKNIAPMLYLFFYKKKSSFYDHYHMRPYLMASFLLFLFRVVFSFVPLEDRSSA